VIDAGLDARVSIEDQLARGRRIGLAETVIQPANDGREDYDHRSWRAGTELLIKKVKGLVKSGQFEHGPTFLFVDLNQWVVGGDAIRSLIPVYPVDDTGACVSGQLWYIAFGEIGNQMFRPPEFEGRSNMDGTLACTGVLKAHRDICGIIFRYGMGEGDILLGLCRGDADSRFHGFMEQVADYWNTDNNCRDYLLQQTFQDRQRMQLGVQR